MIKQEEISIRDKLLFNPDYLTTVPMEYLSPVEQYWKINLGNLKHTKKKNLSKIKSPIQELKDVGWLGDLSLWKHFIFDLWKIKKEKQNLKIPGVYIFIQLSTKKIIYVGQSGNLYGRLLYHYQSKKFEHIKNLGIKCRKEKFNFERFTLEVKLINRLKPIMNKRAE